MMTLLNLSERLRLLAALLLDLITRITRRPTTETAHDRTWRAHPAVQTDDQLTIGQRAADVMRGALSTWTFLGLLAGVMALWIATGAFGQDPKPYILLNLCLSTLAGIQGVVLLIAAKRADQIAAAVALHTLENTERLATLIEQNTALTEQIVTLTSEVHANLAPSPAAPAAPAAPIVKPATRSSKKVRVPA